MTTNNNNKRVARCMVDDSHNDDDDDPKIKNSKLATTASSSTSGNASKTISELQDLLMKLGEDTLPLSFIARYSLTSKEKTSNNKDEKDDEEKEAALKYSDTVLLDLMEKHVGPLDDILRGMIRVHKVAVNYDLEQQQYSGSYYLYNNTSLIEQYRCPMYRHLKGPQPDLLIYTELLFGRSAAVEASSTGSSDDTNSTTSDIDFKSLNAINEHLTPFRTDTMTFQYKVNILINALRYLRDRASNDTAINAVESNNNTEHHLSSSVEVWRWIRFATIYGLSGTISDILDGKYHGHNDHYNHHCTTMSININTPIPMVDQKKERYASIMLNSILYVPIYVIASALGHTHVVKHVLNELGGDVHAKMSTNQQHQSSEDDDNDDGTDDSDEERQPLTSLLSDKDKLQSGSVRLALLWAIYNNDIDMVQCLIKDCGIQFRWLSIDDYDRLWYLLLNYESYDDHTVKFRDSKFKHLFHDPMSMVGYNKHMRLWLRRRATWKPKERMLRVLIECGLPQKLFLPVDLDFSIHKELIEQYTGSTDDDEETNAAKISKSDQQRCKDFEKSLSRIEKKYYNEVHRACASFNDVVEPPEGEALEEDYIESSNSNSDDGDDNNHINKDDDDEDDDNNGVPSKETPETKKKNDGDKTLYVPFFYERLINMWNHQTNAQECKLPEFEEYDPRWVEERVKRERKETGENNSDEEQSDFYDSSSESFESESP